MPPDPNDWEKEEKDKDKFKKYEHFKKQDGSERYECHKSESLQWQEAKPFKNEFRTNGLQGKDKEYYRWDMKHKDIEIYDSKGRYVGSKDPVTGKMYRKGDMQINKQLEGRL